MTSLVKVLEGTNPVKIVTTCKQGLVRSVGLADVLKLHFEPVDVLPVGLNSNSPATLAMLYNWCNHFIVMEEKYRQRAIDRIGYDSKIIVCPVGPDVFGNSHDRKLIDFAWRWTRDNSKLLGITEHNRKI